MFNLEKTAVPNANDTDETPSDDVKYIKIDNTTYKVVSKYVGKYSLLELVKSAIRRDVERGNY